MDPQALADEFAGRGRAVRGRLGEPGYIERIDAGERVTGTFRHGSGGPGGPTTRATIRHGTADAVHIVPAHPRIPCKTAKMTGQNIQENLQYSIEIVWPKKPIPALRIYGYSINSAAKIT